MEGVWRATGDVVIFLDSHIEATPGWMQPLLARIKEDPKKVVLPKVDSIDAETFQYTSSPRDGIGVLGFSWSLGQRPWPVADYGQ
ncbi:galnt11, partial [Symbiodinium pilosum]